MHRNREKQKQRNGDQLYTNNDMISRISKSLRLRSGPQYNNNNTNNKSNRHYHHQHQHSQELCEEHSHFTYSVYNTLEIS
jgi:hypothetical protein